MMVYFSTVRRKRPVREAGELVRLDWRSKQILQRLPLFPADPDILEDPNPRGNSRGGKGLCIHRNCLIAGTYHTLGVYDPELSLLRRITNPLFVNIHEICPDQDLLWVSSTTIDCALAVDQEGRTIRSWWPREEPRLQEKFGLRPMEIDKTADQRLCHVRAEVSTKEHHTHLNSVFLWNGLPCALLSRQGTVVAIESPARIIIEHPALCGAHSPAVFPGGNRLIAGASQHRSLLLFALPNGALIEQIRLTDFPEIASLLRQHPDQPFNKSIFVRGIEILDQDRVLAGIAPAAILEIDVRRKKLLDLYQDSTNVGDTIHGLVHWPERDRQITPAGAVPLS